MIDSVLLHLPYGTFTLGNDGYFDGESIKHMNRVVTIRTRFSNRFEALKKLGMYVPVVQLKHRKVSNRVAGMSRDQFDLEIQASLPKLLYNTNLWEIDEKSFVFILGNMQKALLKMGVSTTIEALRDAELKRVDFAKSIRVAAVYGSVRHVIRVLSSMGEKQRSEIRLRGYMDVSDGVALKFHNSTQGFCLYDKFAELVANGYTTKEQATVKWLKETNQVRNLLRIEFSLQRKQALNAFLNARTGKKGSWTMGDLFSHPGLSRTILLEIFDSVFDKRFAVYCSLIEMTEHDLEEHLLSLNLPIQEHALLSYTVQKCVKLGTNGFAAELRERTAKSTYRRHIKQIVELAAKFSGMRGETPYIIQYIRQQLSTFKLFIP